MKHFLWLTILWAISPQFATGATSDLEGNWITPDHSVVAVFTCRGTELCINIIQPSDRTAKDDKNADVNLRSRSLCGLQIGRSFVATDASHAKGGTIYDPDSGKTYKATMAADNSHLRLRGFIGVSLFGRTEVWQRTQEHVPACTP